MRIEMAYGKANSILDVPDNNIVDVFDAKKIPILPDARIEITKNLLRPIGFNTSLFDIAKNKKSACILLCEETNPGIIDIVLPPILKTLHAAGMSYKDIRIILAKALFPSGSPVDIATNFPKEIMKNYSIIVHDPSDHAAFKYVGKATNGAKIYIVRRCMDVELKISIGLLHPAQMAGLSLGCNLVVGGITSFRTLNELMNIDKYFSLDPEKSIQKNLLYKNLLEIANLAGIDFLVNIAVNQKSEIAAIFAGELKLTAYKSLRCFIKLFSTVVHSRVEIVWTSAGGYPFDRSVYHSIRALISALPLVKPNGAIIVFAECSDGIGSDSFRALLRGNGCTALPNSEKQCFAELFRCKEFQFVKNNANIVFISDKLRETNVGRVPFPCMNTNEALEFAANRYGHAAKMAVIPHGPLTLTFPG